MAGEGVPSVTPFKKWFGLFDLGNALPWTAFIFSLRLRVKNCLFLMLSASEHLNLTVLGTLWEGEEALV